MNTRLFAFSLRPALAYVALSIVLPGLVYATVQQDLRQSANDPQIQLAEDTARALNQGQAVATLTAGAPVDMRASLAPFITIVDSTRQVLGSTGQLAGRVVLPPAGVFEASLSGRHRDSPAGENRVTWQPAPDVRQAAVVVPFSGGYVLAARNLREVEVRQERTFGFAAGAAGLLGLIGLLISSNMFKRKHRI